MELSSGGPASSTYQGRTASQCCDGTLARQGMCNLSLRAVGLFVKKSALRDEHRARDTRKWIAVVQNLGAATPSKFGAALETSHGTLGEASGH